MSIALFGNSGAPAAEPTNRPLDHPLEPAKFVSPPGEYRPVDCWWWENAVLSKERLSWQLEEMHAKGVGGTWLYPRFGASQPRSSEPGFWTDGWWQFVRFALDEQQRLGMTQFANDWLGRLDKAFFQNQLRRESQKHASLVGHRLVAHFARSSAAETLSITVPQNERILTAAAYKLREAQEEAVDDEARVELAEFIHGRELKWEAPEPEWLVGVICSQPHDLNYLRPEVAKRWMEILYEPYAKELGSRLGKSLVAYGPDERFVLSGNILYCDALRERYQKEKGADPLPDLAALFIDIGPRTDSVRCKYFDTMNTLLEENLYAPMAKWLHDRGMQHVTIATWGRENMLQQTSNYGDFPRMMKYFDMPGNEDSKESGSGGAFIDTKMSSSMAHLNGCKRVGLCAYWGMGWGFTQEENIARTNANYALGVNLYNTHGVVYSLLGGRNEWVPPEVHFYQPYWKTWRTFTDYVSRLSYVLSQGQHHADIALIYPLSTIHANWRGGSKFGPAAHEAQASTFALAKSIYAQSLDFDFVDEARLATASIKRGTIKINDSEFRAVVLPTMSTIRAEVVAKLRKFVAAGGTLIIHQHPPVASAESGREDPALLEAWRELLGDGLNATDKIVTHRNVAGGQTIQVRSTEADVAKLARGSISPDVTTESSDLMHTHRRVDNQDVYYFVNRRPHSRDITLTVRSTGQPEIWDARTAKTRAFYRFESLANATKLRLAMEPHEGILIVFQPKKVGPQLIADNLLTVQSIEKNSKELVVTGTASTAEKISAEVLLDGKLFSGSVSALPVKSLDLSGLWECDYRPTMNNKWGDFRYPASDEVIGPEAPRVKYREELTTGEARAQWHARELNDDDWQSVTCTFGPYWQVLDPVPAKLESEQFRAKIISSPTEQAPLTGTGGKSLEWCPYTFSWKFGAERVDVHQTGTDGLGPVSPDFLVFDPVRGSQPVIHYLATQVYAPRDESFFIDFGGQDQSTERQAWINGKLVLDTRDQSLRSPSKVALKGGSNRLVLRIEHTGAKKLATYAVLHRETKSPEQPRFMPLSRWYNIAPDLIYNCRPNGQEAIGWYRFVAPPGAQEAKLNLSAKSVAAWIDGAPVDVVDDTIRFPKSAAEPTRMSQVALRVHQKPGCYEGAAFLAPIAFKCGKGKIALGDWSKSGLAYYSGGVTYTRHVHLDDSYKPYQLLLDLGDVRTSSEVRVNGRSVGVRLARPFTFDVTDAVRPGDNEIEVEVLNTLANYMSAGPSKYVYPGQTVSGLLGPVTLQFLPKVQLRCRQVDSERVNVEGGTG